MQRIFFAFLLWIPILCACSTSNTPTAEATFAPPTATVYVDVPGCIFQWAYKDLPELSRSFEQSIQRLQPEAQARAYAFGENCLRPDGSIANFLPQTTDFDITLQVDDLANESRLGEWIVQVMQVIENVPVEQIRGTGLGRVCIVFQSGTAENVVDFFVQRYQELPPGLSNAEIYQAMLKTVP